MAVYEVGYKVGAMTGLITAPFLAAWPQFAFSSLKHPNAPAIYRNALSFITTGCTITALVIIAFRSEIVGFMAPPSYSVAVLVVPWVAISQIAWGMYPVLSIGPKISKKTLTLAWVSGVAALVNVILNVLLIPKLGIIGAAIATLVAYFLISTIVYIVGQKHYPFPIDWARLSKLFLAAGLIILLLFQLGRLDMTIWLGRVLRILALFLFPVVLLLEGFVTLNQGRMLWKLGVEEIQGRIKKA